jgi:spore coat polysaccharide biosynthesis protein SpsF
MSRSVAIVQARVGSSRLPNKVFLKVGELLLIERVINVLKHSSEINDIVVATTLKEQDDIIIEWCLENKIKYFRGPEDDVLKRYYDCALNFKADIIIRITADDPFKDYLLIDKMIKLFKQKTLDFLCNNNPPTFPEGADIEIFNLKTLKKMHTNAKGEFQREHVTQFCHQNKSLFKYQNLKSKEDFSQYRLTIDTHLDLDFCNKLCYLLPNLKSKNLPLQQIINVLQRNKDFALSNITEKRSDMFKKQQ